MDRWDVIIILIAGYLAIMALVRMMARLRNQVVNHVREQISQHRSKKSRPKESSQDTDRGAA